MNSERRTFTCSVTTDNRSSSSVTDTHSAHKHEIMHPSTASPKLSYLIWVKSITFRTWFKSNPLVAKQSTYTHPSYVPIHMYIHISRGLMQGINMEKSIFNLIVFCFLAQSYCRHKFSHLLLFYVLSGFKSPGSIRFDHFVRIQDGISFQIDICLCQVMSVADVGSSARAGVSLKDIPYRFNTLRPRQNGRHFADDIFKCIFLMKMFEFL